MIKRCKATPARNKPIAPLPHIDHFDRTALTITTQAFEKRCKIRILCGSWMCPVSHQPSGFNTVERQAQDKSAFTPGTAQFTADLIESRTDGGFTRNAGDWCRGRDRV